MAVTDSTMQNLRLRANLGFGLFALGNGLVIVSTFLPFFELMSTATSLIASFVGELVALTSIIFLGKAGYQAIQKALFGFIEKGYKVGVSRSRHRIGITLFCFNFVAVYFALIVAWGSFDDAVAGVNFLGMSYQEKDEIILWLMVACEISFLSSLYLLGADWWERFRNIFIWKPST